jgi:hypothetical protein
MAIQAKIKLGELPIMPALLDLVHAMLLLAALEFCSVGVRLRSHLWSVRLVHVQSGPRMGRRRPGGGDRLTVVPTAVVLGRDKCAAVVWV